jgi:D-alanine-D-alanine ligase
MKSLPSILIMHNIPSGEPCEESGNQSRDGVLDEVEAVRRALKESGAVFRSTGVQTLHDVTEALAAAPEQIIFNLVEELAGPPENYDYFPFLCEAFGKAVTGNGTASLLLTQDKWRSKDVLRSAGLPVPAGVLVNEGEQPVLPPDVSGPWIIKPVATDASEGISGAHVFKSAGAELNKAVAGLHRRFHMPVLVEQFVGTREFNISIIERDGKQEVLPIAEISFEGFPENKPRIVDYAAKWLVGSFEYDHTCRKIPADVTPALAAALEHAALLAWRACGCRDYARVDLRSGENDSVFVLEVNANPDIAAEAGLPAALEAGGISYNEFVTAMIRNAESRLTGKAPAISTADVSDGIRFSKAEDRDEILRFTEATGHFRPGELTIAAEVLDDALLAGPQGHYQSYTFIKNNRPAGWVAFGPTPCTIGTFDIYWIVVSPDFQRQGIGRALMEHAEQLIRAKDGRLLIIETSGAELYSATRGFYHAVGFQEKSCIPDFYAVGDPKVVYTKPLGTP